MTVGIIGGGASGMAAALAAAENCSVQVILIERQARVGRKLQATGNGRCNLTNLIPRPYHGKNPGFGEAALSAFGPEETLAWFRGLGLFTTAEPGGRVYPYSDQANSVVDVLRLSLERPNITVKLGYEVKKIQKQGNGFLLSDGTEKIFCDRVIVACGGLAGTKLGGSMAGYRLLAKLGHRSTRLRPALVQLRCSWGGVTALKGIRANCRAEIFHNESLFARSTGELQFTQFGISGPVIFEISRDVCSLPGNWSCKMDFLPEVSAKVLEAELQRRRQTDLPMEELMTGILHNRLGRVLTRAAGVKNKQYVRELSDQELLEVCRAAKCFELEITEPLGMDSAQVTAGGILTEQFDPETMESRLIPGLYACGEILDVDGDCGGYNLQWAWSSGRCAGLHAGKEPK